METKYEHRIKCINGSCAKFLGLEGELNGGIETPNTVGDPKSLGPKEFAIAKDPKRCHNPSHTTRFILGAI